MDKNGVSQLKHLEEVERQAGGQFVPPELLEYRDKSCPPEMLSFWFDFLDLSERRGSTEGGPNVITHEQYKAWADINDMQPSTFHQDVLFALDRLWIKNHYDGIKNRK